ncbi:hypothetical protein C9I98_02360 [Photobacterium sanctipauli]|uniref:Cupin domain-containing protein n=1 Tax=Photobacterium sanctipauli TaxID=1342794 RepID=A0A2T3P0X8_9GAMM|nr:hypothetical protein [Photobacterium sanctipauli]PSW22128.1 hypothetical protein C9I98_02360 [Photobacterium sanctipauli]
MLETSKEVMGNGEIRYRMKANDGSGYIRTVYQGAGCGDRGAWQNSHYHLSTLETYIVQSGSILFAELHDGVPVVKQYTSGEIVTAKVGVPHNVFVRPGTDLHTVKHGDVVADDWHPSPELDLALADLD